MSPIRLLTVLTAAALLVGCASDYQESGESGPSSLTADRVAQIRANYQSVNPDTRVGYINAVLPESNLVSVTDVPVADFANGDAVTFIDQKEQVIANGRVVNIVGNDVHVKFEPTVRAPQLGDLAVKFMR